MISRQSNSHTRQAIALRIRWYGKEEGLTAVYVERKTHREDWYGDGPASAKERFPLREEEVVPFLHGRLSPDEYASRLQATRSALGGAARRCRVRGGSRHSVGVRVWAGVLRLRQLVRWGGLLRVCRRLGWQVNI